MHHGLFHTSIDSFNAACFSLLALLALFVMAEGRSPAHARLRYIFLWLALSLMSWQLTLFVETRTALSALQLSLGRVNFAAISLAAYLALRLVQEILTGGSTRLARPSRWLLIFTLVVVGCTVLTPLVDAEEHVVSGVAVSVYGLFFPLYLVQVMGCLGMALWTVHRGRTSTSARVRGQMTVIGLGMLGTAGVAGVTNVLLPVFGDFRFSGLGTLSVGVFLFAVAYAIFIHRLFDLRTLVRKTVVYGILLALVLGAYGATVLLVTDYLTNGVDFLTRYTVLLIAFSFDPLRRLLEKKTDRLLFVERNGEVVGADQRRRSVRNDRRG